MAFGRSGDGAQKQRESGRGNRKTLDGETRRVVADDKDRRVHVRSMYMQQGKVGAERHGRRMGEGIGQGVQFFPGVRKGGAQEEKEGFRKGG